MSRAARTAGSIALDTEFLRERTYRARLCLVQVAVADDIYLIDPVRGAEPAALASVIGDPAIEVVVHAGRQDLEIFYDSYGIVPKNVFDVQIAAGFLGYGASLPYGRLVEAVLGVKLSKGESYTDWCRRPLTESQLTYAADDVRYLLEVAGRFRRDLQSRGRAAWAAEEMAALERTDAYEVDRNEVWRKVSGRASLSPRQMAVLREVARWREDVAEKRDTPRGWVLKDATLVEIARRCPQDARALQHIRGMAPKEIERSARDLVAAVERGKGAPLIDIPNPPPRNVLARARILSRLADAVVRARCEAADIAVELVTTRDEVEALLVSALAGTVEPARHRILQGWRRDLAGDVIIALAEGRIAVKATSAPPYIAEIAVGGSNEGRGHE